MQLWSLTASSLARALRATCPDLSCFKPKVQYESRTRGSHCRKKAFLRKPSFASFLLVHCSFLTIAPLVSPATDRWSVGQGSTGSQKMTEAKTDGTALDAYAMPPPPSECPIPTIRRSRHVRSEDCVAPAGCSRVSRARREGSAGTRGRRVEDEEAFDGVSR